MVILYVETNFLMAIAKGQDVVAENLLQNVPSSIRIAIPDICYVEALGRCEKEKYYIQQFEKELNKQINNSERDATSNNAKSFLYHLEQTRILNQSLLNDVKVRLFDTIDKLLTKAEVINLNSNLIRVVSETSIFQPETFLIKNDLMDNLILQCILSHATLYPRDNKVFLSSNHNDFAKPEVQEALQNVGIKKYFTNTQNFIGWLQSQSN